MHPQERQSWFLLVVLVGTLTAYLILGSLIGFGRGTEAAFGLFGLAGFAGLIGRKERRQHKVFMDERDTAIGQTATSIGYCIFWVAFVLACMIPWAVLPRQATIPVDALPNFVIFAMILIFTVRAAVIIFLYHRQSPTTPGDNLHV